MEPIDEKQIQENVNLRRAKRVAARTLGSWGKIAQAMTALNLKDRWLLYVAVFISAALTGASVFLILAGASVDPWRMAFAGFFAIVAVAICEPALLWWLNRVEYHQNNIQAFVSIAGLIASAVMTARTVYSAGELLIWALGDNIFSNYTAINPSTQDWLVHFIPILVMIHICLGLIYFSVSAEATAKRSVENTRRNADTRIKTAMADMQADKAEAQADAMSTLIAELAPKMGIEQAKREMISFMVANGFDANNDGTISPDELAAFRKWSQNNKQQAQQAFSRPQEQPRQQEHQPQRQPQPYYNADVQSQVGDPNSNRQDRGNGHH